MDKKAWIVITACILGLVANWWYTASREQERKAAAAPVAQAPAQAAPQQTASGDAAAPAASVASAASSGAAPAAGTPQSTPAPAAVSLPKVIAELVSHDSKGQEVARFRFRDIGGSLESTQMVGKAVNSTKEELREDVLINGSSKYGVGTLMFNLSNNREPVWDNAVYSLKEQTDKKVVLEARLGALIVTKTYSLIPVDEGDEIVEGCAYMLHLDITVQNTGRENLAYGNWGIFAGTTNRISTSEMRNYTYFIYLADDDFEKEGGGTFSHWFSKDELRRYKTDYNKLEWAGVMSQYYASIICPSTQDRTDALYIAPTKVRLPITGETEEGLMLGLGMPEFSLPASDGQVYHAFRFNYDIFTGPRLNSMLKDMTGYVHKIDYIMDYGIFYIISNPMSWLINTFHGWFGNWGWAIVAMTFVVRLLIWPLYRKSYMSMKRMSLLQPKMKELKEMYPNDQQRVSMEMMKLYREYGISPFGGCLPMLLQLPIFLSFYYVLQTAAEFRGAPFLGWVTDLSQMDTVCYLPLGFYDLPINVLPIIMALTMILQMHMSPAAGDPTQQKIMKFMPLVFFLFCYTFPSALALYWTTQNIISIGQTWYIRRLPMPELTKVDPKKKKGGKKSFFERMMEAQQQALAEQQQREKNMRNVTRK